MLKIVKIIFLYLTTKTFQSENFEEINNLLNVNLEKQMQISQKLKTTNSYELSTNLFLISKIDSKLESSSKIKKIQNYEIFKYVTKKETKKVQNQIFIILTKKSILIRSENLEILKKIDLTFEDNSLDCVKFTKKDIYCVEYNSSELKIHKFFFEIPQPYGRKINVKKKIIKEYKKKNFLELLKKISKNSENNFVDFKIEKLFLLGIEFDINLFFITKNKEYHLYSLLKNPFLIETEKLDFKNFIRSNKNIIICYGSKIKVFNPVGTLLKKHDFDNKIENCLFNYDKFVSLYILFENGGFAKIFLTGNLKINKNGFYEKKEIFYNDKISFEKLEKGLKINFKKKQKSEIFEIDEKIENLFIIKRITTNQFFVIFEKKFEIELFSYQKGQYKGTVYKEDAKSYKIPSLFLILGFVVVYNLFCKGKIREVKQRKKVVEGETRRKLGNFSRKYREKGD